MSEQKNDEVKEFIETMATRRTARLNSAVDWTPARPELPEPTGDPVADFIARISAIEVVQTLSFRTRG